MLIGSINDHLAPSGPVAGQVLDGLWLGVPSGRVSLENIVLALPAHQQTVACVHVNTRDGEYWLDGRFAVNVAEAIPGQLQIKSKYEPDLSAKPLADLGVRAELKPDCDSATPGSVVPAVAAGPPFRTLVALVNSQRAAATSATLHAPDGEAATVASCAPVHEDRNTAFDTVCTIDLPARLATLPYTLKVDRLTRAGDDEVDSFSLLLAYPPAGSL